jgi:predicted phage baseplate assembly protein
MEELKARTRRELRAQLRAVTAEDYEDLTKKATRSIARVKCNIPQGSNGRLPPGMIEILVVPAVADSIWAGDLSKLEVDEGLTRTIENFLDKYRLLTTTLQIKEPRYIGLKVTAEIVPAEYSQPEEVKARVVESLCKFLTPLAMGGEHEELDELMGADWAGWPFGRDLYLAEIYSLIQRVPGVKHVLDVQLSSRSVLPAKENPPENAAPAGEALKPIKQKVVRVRADTLLCSLAHDIVLAELEEETDDVD